MTARHVENELYDIFGCARAGIAQGRYSLGKGQQGAVHHGDQQIAFAAEVIMHQGRVYTGFFRQLPAEIEEAARVDGAGRMRVLFEVVLPLSAPALATTAILTFVYCWNEFLFALSFTLGPERQTVPVAIALFRGQYQVPWGEILAAAIVSTAPVAALVLAFQRRIVQGLVSGAIKG